MPYITIISSSIRDGRQSHRVALFLKQYLEENQLAEVEILDLKTYQFPLFTERLAYQSHPSEQLLDFTDKFNRAGGVIIVSPVYNASFPAALKNVIDLYYTEWHRKPVAITSVTSGKVPGIATVQQLQTLLLKLGALVAPVACTVINGGEDFDEQGHPTQKEQGYALVKPMIEEFFWLINR